MRDKTPNPSIYAGAPHHLPTLYPPPSKRLQPNGPCAPPPHILSFWCCLFPMAAAAAAAGAALRRHRRPPARGGGPLAVPGCARGEPGRKEPRAAKRLSCPEGRGCSHFRPGGVPQLRAPPEAGAARERSGRLGDDCSGGCPRVSCSSSSARALRHLLQPAPRGGCLAFPGRVALGCKLSSCPEQLCTKPRKRLNSFFLYVLLFLLHLQVHSKCSRTRW